jgi:hypothetical protein
MSQTLTTGTKRATRAARTQAPALPAPEAPRVLDAQAAQAARAEAERAAWVEAMRVDHAAETSAGTFTGTFEAYLEHQAVEPERQRYQGRMLALVRARKAYVRGANGHQHSGDWLASQMESLPRERVVEACMRLLKLDANPYRHLNPGQQSMNLRNKVRGACGRGEISVSEVQTLVAAYVDAARVTTTALVA